VKNRFRSLFEDIPQNLSDEEFMEILKEREQAFSFECDCADGEHNTGHAYWIPFIDNKTNIVYQVRVSADDPLFVNKYSNKTLEKLFNRYL
jgi:hypothetical protein